MDQNSNQSSVKSGIYADIGLSNETQAKIKMSQMYVDSVVESSRLKTKIMNMQTIIERLIFLAAALGAVSVMELIYIIQSF